MADLSSFPITSRWPAKHPERLQLYSTATPNGVKVSIMLEETGLPYEAHYVNLGNNETWTPEFLSLNPNGKSKRLLGVLERRLEGRDWIMGEEYTIADISILGWVRNLIRSYEAGELVNFDSLKRVPAWLERGLARPAVERGLHVPRRPE
jgi:glutathione S-transferase